MFVVNEDLSIYVTRGDMLFLKITTKKNGKPYTFQVGEVIRFKVYEKKNCANVVLQKDFPVTAVTQGVDVILNKQDTRIGETINKPVDYWYEVELNPFDNPQTIIGYDGEGTKVFRLFPEGEDIEAPEVNPEDIPVIDTELDMTSTRPIENQAIARAFANLQAGYQATHEAVAQRYATPQMYGAIGDGVSDDTEAINKCLADNSRVFIPKGTYIIDPSVSLIMHNDQVLELSENTIIKAFVADETKYNYAITISGVSNVTVKGGKICGDKNEYPDSTAERGYGIFIKNSKNVTVEDCEISDFRGDCIIIESYSHPYPTSTAEYDVFVNRNISIKGCYIHNSLRHGITVMGVRGLLVKDTEILYTNGKTYSTAIDAETHYEWQEASNFRYENVKAKYCGNGVMFNQNSWDGSISEVSIEHCEFYRVQLGISGDTSISRSSIDIISTSTTDNLTVNHCVLGMCSIPYHVKKVTFNSCVFNCSEYQPDAITFQYSAETSSVDCVFNDCVFNSYFTNVKDVTKKMFNIQCTPNSLAFIGCTIYANNPNGIIFSAENLLKVYGCKFIYNFNQEGYPSALISVYAKESWIVGNTFDTTQAYATNNDRCVIEGSQGDVYFINNVGVMKEKYGVSLSFTTGESGRTWTYMNNVFPKYTGKGNSVTGVTYIDVGNIYESTT